MPLSLIKSPLRVAFMNMNSPLWAAGNHYLKNLFFALKSLDETQRPEIALLVSPQSSPDSYVSLQPYLDQHIAWPPTTGDSGFVTRQINLVKRWVIRDSSSSLAAYLREQQVASVFALSDFGPRFNVPLLAWIPDFQHVHLPEMFSQQEIQNRNQKFLRIANHASRIIMSSENARGDFVRFAPSAINKARVLSFVAQSPADIYDSTPDWVCEHYHLPRRFIYLPNQFWKHKNHEIVVKALTLVKNRHPEIVVVCTGNPNDNRHPLYFAELLASVSAFGLRNNFIILGMIPHSHLFHLMRQSLAVLQPSLFEGWSTTVEEVKSLGKRVILSDIPVHREQNPPASMFFNPHDPQDLAECMALTFETASSGPDDALESQAREQLPYRTREFGRIFMEIVHEALRV